MPNPLEAADILKGALDAAEITAKGGDASKALFEASGLDGKGMSAVRLGDTTVSRSADGSLHFDWLNEGMPQSMHIGTDSDGAVSSVTNSAGRVIDTSATRDFEPLPAAPIVPYAEREPFQDEHGLLEPLQGGGVRVTRPDGVIETIGREGFAHELYPDGTKIGYLDGPQPSDITTPNGLVLETDGMGRPSSIRLSHNKASA